MLGTPLPDNLAELPLEDLHKLHAATWAESAEIKAKRASILPFIQVKTAAKNLATRAGFDTTLNLGGQELTQSGAKALVEQAAKGLLKLPANVLRALSDFANGGGE
jgi:hypothetical protein